MISTQKVFALAVKHLADKPLDDAARFCLAEARARQEDGDLTAARRWALRSLLYSVGMQHADYKRADKR